VKKYNKYSNIKFNVVVFASGGGGNFQALIDKQIDFGYTITLLLVDRKCGAIKRAMTNNIPFVLIEKKELKDLFFAEVKKNIPKDTNLIVLAGFLSIISDDFCKTWRGRIINSHPSLLPKYGGKGMIGVKVQEAVIKAKENIAGCTIHYVTEKVDGGEIILQKSINTNLNETPWQLGNRIHKEENILLPKAIKILKKKLKNYI